LLNLTKNFKRKRRKKGKIREMMKKKQSVVVVIYSLMKIQANLNLFGTFFYS
jgi:hypothetical protein